MNTSATKTKTVAFLIASIWTAPSAWAFDSGSTGADGAFSPTASMELQLPPNGIFNFTTVNIPSGVTITFKKNATNTPVVILASGDVTINGAIKLNGGASTPSGTAGNGNFADDGIPGVGGPGGYDGGRGGLAGANIRGGNGLGPGGGWPGDYMSGSYTNYPGGGGGGFGSPGGVAYKNNGSTIGGGGTTYGASTLLPLIGGSGGGGGSGTPTFAGSGGGGGAGVILIASSGTVTVNGSINADGGVSGATGGTGGDRGGSGGGGSGGAIRIVATTIAGNGTIQAVGGGPGDGGYGVGGGGGSGRIRLEAENMTRTKVTSPGFTLGAPGAVFVPGLPTLKITDIAGVAVPTSPTGNADVSLPADITNPVTVNLAASGIPLGTTITLTVTPARTAPGTATSTALAGTVENATASASVNLPPGPSVLSATTSYTVTAAVGDALSMFAQGERVEKIELAAGINTPSMVTLITVSGKRFTMPSAVAANYISG
jgi:hypothetical protein